MVLPSLFSKNTTQNSQAKFFLALLITDSTIQAGFWDVSQDSISIRQHSGVYTYHDAQTLLVEADKALQQLGKESEEVEEVIFGLEFNWVDDKGIADLKKPLLKKLTKELALKPVGFVVSTEALFHSLVAEDTQLSTLLIQYAAEHITVSIINRGKLVNSERVGRSEDPGADIQEATARLLTNQDNLVLPPKVHLVSPMVGTEELKNLKKKLAAFDWSEVNPKINHQPVVEILPANAMLEAVIQEGGKAVADAQGYQITGSLDKSMAKEPVPVSKSENSEVAATDQPRFDNAVPFTAETDTDTQASKNPFAQQFSKPSFAGVMNKTNTPLKNMFASPTANWMSHHLTFVIGGFIAGLLALLVIGVVSLLSAKTAMVELLLAAKTVTNEVEITLDPTIDTSSPEDLLLKAELLESSFSESKTIDTTGVKKIGDKATGRVTITNKTDDEITIKAGTLLVGGGVTFNLDDEIRVASSSVSQNDQGETKTYGKTDASVTAAAVGAEGNLGKEIAFSVGTYGENSVTAESSEAFTGGSSREVRVVSEEDRGVLLAEVKKLITQKAEAEFKDQSSSGTYTIPTGELTVTDSEFDAAAGDEATSLSLTLEADVSAVTYLTEDVASLVGFALKDAIPEGYALSEKEPSILSQPDENASGSASRVILNTNISAQALPKFNQDSFKSEISGQSPSSAEAILRGKGEVEEATVILKPSYVTFLSNSVPKKVDKIIFAIVN